MSAGVTAPPEVLVVLVVDGVRFRAPLPRGGTLRFGHGTGHDVHLPPALAVPAASVRAADDGVLLDVGGDPVPLDPDGGWTSCVAGGSEIQACVAPVPDRVVLDLRGRRQIDLGPQPGATVRLVGTGVALTARRADGGWLVTTTGDDVFVHNLRRPAGRLELRDGDHLGIGAHDLVLTPDELHVDDGLVAATVLPRRPASALTPPAGYPDVRRSPRLVHRPPEGKVTVDAVPQPEEHRAGQLAKLVVPPLTMLGVTGGMAVLNGNPLLVLTSGATTLVTLAFSIVGAVKERRRKTVREAELLAAYQEHLEERAVELHEAHDRQRRGALHHYPDVATLTEMAARHSPRVFEKSATHADFLCYRIGLGDVGSSVVVENGDTTRVTVGDELAQAARDLCEEAATLARMPVVADLRHGQVGYIGPRRLVVEQLQLLVHQVAFFHSYHDVQLVMVFPPAERDDWSWMRWYRHASLQDVNLRAFVSDQRSRDQVLSRLNQVLKARQQALAEQRGGQSTVFTPHYVVVVLDETLVMDHVVMEFLREDAAALGCSVVVVQETLSSLSDSVTTVVDVRDRDTGVLVLEQGELRDTPFALDHLPDGFDPERLPRTVGALRHLLDVRSSIPRSVTFLELYGVERFEELGVLARWAANSPHRTLGVPLGLRGPGDVVTLDLHEKAHGPHGLVAGTTGSGKSEIIQSYILSLAVNFHPHDVAFLLIDYKGGGMANLFSDLPHLLGTITNLDGAQSMRALVSINAELKRRQRLFAEHGVNHVNQYQKLVKNGDAAEPMPHLFLISDEFAELKSEQPEFMDELISTARIGRSLGIHLILATQKPSGVVNDQIWSNAKFKLALKVADKSDSMEILKTPDAAEITLPGRAYLQVGNNEIYELFQSAWSGADYEPDAAEQHQEDHAIYRINDLGQYEILTPDLSGLDGVDEVRQVPTELEAVVAGIRGTAVEARIEPVPRPWLPPLPERIVVTDLHPADPAAAWQRPKSGLAPVVGTVDIPSRQTQEVLRLDLSGDGHLAVFASPGYGKSTFLQTLVMDLARAHSPAHLHVYLLDLGTNGLLPLRGLPHVADTVTVDDAQKARKLAERIAGEMRHRKQLLSGHAVATLEMYERASGATLPHLLLVVDGFDGLKGSRSEEVLTDLLHAVAREGAGLGIHLTISAGRGASMRAQLTANIKRHVVLRLNDDGEARTIVGRTAHVVDDVPGRGLVKLEQPEVFQTAVPAAGDDALGVIEQVRAEADRMARAWQGERPVPIPVIPEVLTLSALTATPEAARLVTDRVLPVGLGFDSVLPVGLSPARHRAVLVLGEDGAAVAATMTALWLAGGPAYPAGPFLVDNRSGDLRPLAERLGAPARSPEEALRAAASELTARADAYARAAATPAAPTQAAYVRDLDPALVVVADVAELVTEPADRCAELLQQLATVGPGYGLYLLLGSPLGAPWKGFDGVSKLVKAISAGVVVGAVSAQPVLKASNLGYREPAPGEHEGYVVVDGTAVKVKLPVVG